MMNRGRSAHAAIAVILLLALQPLQAEPDHTVIAAGKAFHVTLATTPQARARGLMEVPALAADEGLLMMFPTSRPVSIWMKNMRIPLDIVWISQSGRVVEIRTAPICEADPCPRYFPDKPARFVLEVGRGHFPAGIGDKIAILDASGDSLLPKRTRDFDRDID